MVIFAIMGLIAAIAGSITLAVHRDMAKPSRARTDLTIIALGLELHQCRTGSFPDTDTGLAALEQSGVLEQPPLDPWGHRYVYVNDDGHPVVMSHGEEGVAGGTGSGQDVTIKVAPRVPRPRDGPHCAP
nr:type II secretion system protein GspG [Myxococcus hansupus]